MVPFFARGVGSILDFGFASTFFNSSTLDFKADLLATVSSERLGGRLIGLTSLLVSANDEAGSASISLLFSSSVARISSSSLIRLPAVTRALFSVAEWENFAGLEYGLLFPPCSGSGLFPLDLEFTDEDGSGNNEGCVNPSTINTSLYADLQHNKEKFVSQIDCREHYLNMLQWSNTIPPRSEHALECAKRNLHFEGGRL